MAQPLRHDREPRRPRRSRTRRTVEVTSVGAGPEAARSSTSTSSPSTSTSEFDEKGRTKYDGQDGVGSGPFTLAEFKKGQFPRFKANPNCWQRPARARRGRSSATTTTRTPWSRPAAAASSTRRSTAPGDAISTSCEDDDDIDDHRGRPGRLRRARHQRRRRPRRSRTRRARTPEVRQAIIYAVDRRRSSSGSLRGLGRAGRRRMSVVSRSDVAAGGPRRGRGSPPDPDRAKAMLDEAG